MNKIFRVALAGLLALLLSGSFLAQADADLPSGSDPAGNGAYLIAPSDVVKITVYQVPDLTVEARIEDNGTVSYPLLGWSALALGCGIWQLHAFRSPEGTTANLVLGAASLLAAGVMIVYGRYFLKKLKNVSYL